MKLAKWAREIDASIEIIKSTGFLLAYTSGINKVRNNEQYASYDLIFKPGLSYISRKSNLLDGYNIDLTKAIKSFGGVQKQLNKIIRSQNQFKNFSTENINHITYGFLLGYPDKAIIESVKFWGSDDPFAERLISANILGAGYYRCPQPVYDYPRNLINDPTITEHERKWSKILKDYYHSEFHKSLANDPKFKIKMEELGNL
jgi:hypothetical protein